MNQIPGLQWNPAGYAALSGPLQTLYADIDSVFTDWAQELGAETQHFPSLIALSDLAPIAYLQSFPQLATFACSPSQQRQKLEEFAQRNKCADRVQPDPEWTESSQILTPATCYHIYPRLAGTELEQDVILTAVCACHRREQEYRPLQRQWCFNMRELVCIGEPDAVETFVNDCQARIESLTARLDLSASWQIATDPFFDPARDPKALAQQIEPVKRELTLDDGLAIASINRHRAFFGECYEINRQGRPAHSACVAFGLERWLHALISRLGDNPATWSGVMAA